jgi:hypothetical protein
MFRNLFFSATILLLVLSCERMILGPDAENTPSGNFETLWKTMDEKYGLFPVTTVNWDSLYTIYYSQINDNTTDDELWNISCQLLSHLGNGHITLENKDHTKWYCPDSPDPNIWDAVSPDIIITHYLENPQVTGEDFILYGKVKNSSLGYIWIITFGGAPNGRDWVRDLDVVIGELSECEGMIIDLRNNGGGFTRNNLYAGSLFINHEIIYYYSRLKTGPGHADFGEIINKNLIPGNASFTKKNAVLTNRFTASGAECFTLIMKCMDYSAQIGDTTMGALGEVPQTGQLPNGWTIKYPCTLTTLADGSSPENIGIAPDLLIDNTLSDVGNGKDRVLDQAVKYLSEN